MKRVNLTARLVPLIVILMNGPALAQTTPPRPETTVDGSRGGVTISSGANSLTIGARLQVRWTLEDREEASGDTIGDGLGIDDGPISQFDVPRMRVSLSGGVYRPWLRYAFQYEFSRTSGESASKLKDAVIEIRPVGRSYRIAVGQFKVPFGLQQLTSSGRLQFVDRAITDSRFNPARDMGVMFAGTAAEGRVGYEAGVFNGSGESVRQNNASHLLAGRLYYQPLGPYTLTEGTTEIAPKPVLHVGLGARTGEQIRDRTLSGVVESPDNQTAVNAEFAVRSGRLFSTAEYFWMTDEQRNPVEARDIDSRGFHAQAGYLVAPRTEVGVLVARLTPDTDVDDAEVTEVRAVAGHYFAGHNLKLQADAGQLRFGPNVGALSARARQGVPSPGSRLVSRQTLGDLQVRVQMQVSF